jgi:hypothetical protein
MYCGFWWWNNSRVYHHIIKKSKFFNTNNDNLKDIKDNYSYDYDTADVNYFKQYIKNRKSQVATHLPGHINTTIFPSDNNPIANNRLELLNINNLDTDNIIVLGNYLIEPEIDANDQYNIINDRQSVHDSYIQRKTKLGYSTIKNDTQQRPLKSDISNDILNYINSSPGNWSSLNIAKLAEIINNIKTRNTFVTNYADTEVNILKNTWNNGDTNVKDQVIKQLMDCESSAGQLYCPTGVATRITESLYINNPENYPKPKEFINQEMLQIAANFKNNYPELEGTQFKHQLIETYKDSYSDIMTESEIKEQIKDWIDYV